MTQRFDDPNSPRRPLTISHTQAKMDDAVSGGGAGCGHALRLAATVMDEVHVVCQALLPTGREECNDWFQ